MPENEGNENQSNQNGSDNSGGGGSVAPAWIAQMPADLKENPAFTSFKTIGDLGKTYLETSGKAKEFESKVKEHEDKVKALEGKIGSEYIPKLKEGATEAEQTAYFKAIGRPEKADDYKFDPIQLPEGAEKVYDPTMEGWFKETAFKIGLSKEQAGFLFKSYADSFADRFTKSVVAETQVKQQAMETLKTEWGAKYAENLIVTDRALEKFGTPEFKKFMDDTKLGNDPRIVKVFYEIGKAIQDDSLILGRQAAPTEAREPGVLKYPSMAENPA